MFIDIDIDIDEASLTLIDETSFYLPLLIDLPIPLFNLCILLLTLILTPYY